MLGIYIRRQYITTACPELDSGNSRIDDVCKANNLCLFFYYQSNCGVLLLKKCKYVIDIYTQKLHLLIEFKPGFLEIVYKDALEFEFGNLGIPYAREKEYGVQYKDTLLPHKFYADFIVFDRIILEVKAAATIHKNYQAQALNYLAVSHEKLAIIVNFGETKLNFQRLIK